MEENVLENKREIEETKKRNIGLDSLRIISMIMIVFLHYLGKGGLLDIKNTSNAYHIIYYFIEALCIIAVNCYVLISGYFLIKSKFKWKKVLQLWLETLFYSIFVYVIIVVLGLKEVDIKGIIKSLFPIVTKQYWFINIYLVMYILSPFLNKLINNMNKKEYQKLLIILIICFSIISVFPDAYTLDSSHGYGIIWFICLYLIAGYIRIYDIPKKLKLNKNFAVVFNLFAIFSNFLHNGFRVLSFFKLNAHFKSHKINSSVFYSGCFFCNIFHFIGAVSTVNINFVAFLHKYPPLFQSFK